MVPQTQFILLTQAASHEELTSLDRANMHRQMVIGPITANSLPSRLRCLVSRTLPYLPGRVRRFASRLGYKLNSMLKRRRSGSLLHDMSADLLFCPFTAPTYFEIGIPTVCTIYDLQYKTYPQFFSEQEVAHRDRIFIEACQKAAALTAISDYSRDSAIAHGGLEPSRIRTIHLRMAQRIVPEDQQDLSVLERLKLSHHRYLMYPANFWRHKNHEMLLTAFGMACREGLPEDIKLVCTGAPGERREFLMHSAQAMNLGERILFPGFLPSLELAALIGNCIGVVFPSLYEGFGLPVIEAMAAGVPVACSNRTSLPEVAADAAILFDPRIPTQISQAMISLVENAELRVRLIEAGLQRAEEFSDSMRMTREYWELFQFACGNKNHENLITGIYLDGWSSSQINIQVGSIANAQALETVFTAPQHKIVIEAYCDGEAIQKPLSILAGKEATLSLPVEPQGGLYELRISPVFVPSLMGLGTDQRELGAKVLRCGISLDNGEYLPFYPEQVPA
ncbi:glycosyl transferase family 1 [Methylomonas lenta]|uniref:Glycosyl transferase family 1 n=2 Tax=Methylomonas lenta TaxID=980561 RepID=A0A177MVJ8_9GAMM|nr:glycosyl transferase family 1 [Methylomonas lenta]